MYREIFPQVTTDVNRYFVITLNYIKKKCLWINFLNDFFLFPSPSYCHFCYVDKVTSDLPTIAPTQYWLMLKPVTDCSGLGKQTFVAFNGGWIRDPNIQDTFKGLLEAIRLRHLSKKKKNEEIEISGSLFPYFNRRIVFDGTIWLHIILHLN